jgi:hypothetical protein
MKVVQPQRPVQQEVVGIVISGPSNPPQKTAFSAYVWGAPGSDEPTT